MNTMIYPQSMYPQKKPWNAIQNLFINFYKTYENNHIVQIDQVYTYQIIFIQLMT